MAAPDPGFERHLTDAGLTGDKINAQDPAAAPVQTDAEAAGQPTSRWAALDAAKHQIATAFATPRPETFGAWKQPGWAERRQGWTLLGWMSLLVALGIVAGMISWR